MEKEKRKEKPYIRRDNKIRKAMGLQNQDNTTTHIN